jgi:hypothetical protein
VSVVTNVCFGSFATKLDRPRHVRFPPDSDRTADIAGGPVRAISILHMAIPSHLATAEALAWSASASAKKRKRTRSGLRRQKHVVHEQRVNARLPECDDRVGGRADDWLAVIEGRIDDERHAGSRKETGYELVKARI